MLKHVLLSLTLAVVFARCSGPSPEEMYARADEAMKRQDFPVALAEFEKVVEAHPESKQAELSLFGIATVYNETREYASAIDAYKKYSALYPDAPQTPMAMFLVGYLYNNELHVLDSAAVAYRSFLARFPSHEMAPSAQFELNNLGKSPEELLPAPDPSTEAVKTPT